VRRGGGCIYRRIRIRAHRRSCVQACCGSIVAAMSPNGHVVELLGWDPRVGLVQLASAALPRLSPGYCELSAPCAVFFRRPGIGITAFPFAGTLLPSSHHFPGGGHSFKWPSWRTCGLTGGLDPTSRQISPPLLPSQGCTRRRRSAPCRL
jgi:hypothetical protein